LITGGGRHVAWAMHRLELAEEANARSLSLPSESFFGGSVDVPHHADLASSFVVLTLIDAHGADTDISRSVGRRPRTQDRCCRGVELGVFFIVAAEPILWRWRTFPTEYTSYDFLREQVVHRKRMKLTRCPTLRRAQRGAAV
jgi:hypothetical protein